MSAVFLSASIPVPERGRFYEDANPFIIQTAVREFMLLTLGRRLVVWGGHPAITPMVWAACEDLGVEFSSAVVLYQSEYFAAQFPSENAQFANTVIVPSVHGDREASLARLRSEMLRRDDLEAAVFAGGMEGTLAEFNMFRQFHPASKIVVLAATGGAARVIAEQNKLIQEGQAGDLDFYRQLSDGLGISPLDPRTTRGASLFRFQG